MGRACDRFPAGVRKRRVWQDLIPFQGDAILIDGDGRGNSFGGELNMEAPALRQYRGRVTCDLRHNGCMVKSVEGIYRNGKVELIEPLAATDGSTVIVTWVHPADPVDLRERGIDQSQAAGLRRRLASFAEDWDRPEMAAYDELPPR